MKRYWCNLIVVTALVGAGCDGEDDPKTRSFLLGFTPFPYAHSEEAVDYVYNKIETDGDIINHHFDNGVPWVEALEGVDFHERVMADWEFRKSRTPANHKVYVSVTPLNESRTGIAPYRGERERMPLPETWTGATFGDQTVKDAYLAYCKRIIDFFQPDYFAMSIEANLFYAKRPGQWTSYYEFHKYIYQQLKSAYPGLPVFTSVAGVYLMPEFVDGNDHLSHRLVTLRLLEFSDYYALSLYPHLSSFRGNPYPEGTLDALFQISEKPLVITETGFAAEPFSIHVDGQTPLDIQSDVVRQQLYLLDLFRACEKRRNIGFVIHFALRDNDQRWKHPGLQPETETTCRNTGLYDDKGQPRPALTVWRQTLLRIYQPQVY